MALRERLVYAIDVVTDGVDTGLNRINKSMKEAEGLTGKLKAGWAATVAEFKNSRELQAAAAGAFVAGSAASIKAASDLEESVNAVNVQYGIAAGGVRKLGDDSATAFGMSERAFNEFAVQFSAFANQIANNSGRQVSDVVGEMATRLADFASVHNLSLQEAQQVATSTLAGETEAFRRFGGDVSAATVETYAYKTGIAEVGTELTEGQKVLARYGLFMQQTDKVAGDFKNTSDSLANQQRIARAQVENLAARYGRELIPAVTNAARAFTTLTNVIDAVGEESGPAGDAVGWLTDRVREAVIPLEAVTKGINGTAEALGYGAEQAELSAEKISWMADADKRATTAANEARTATEERADALDQQRIYAEYAAGASQALADAEAEERAQAQRNIDTTKRLTDEYNVQRRRIDDLIGRKNALIGGEIAVRQAQRDAKAAAEELTTTLADQSTTLDQAAAATDGAVQAQLDAAQAAADYRAKQLEANGTTVDAKVQNQLMKEELQRLAGQLDGPLRDALLRYIEQLNAIPKNVNTIITANGTPGSVPIKPGAKYASGTMSAKPGLALVGEQGPELVSLNGGERIYNARQTGEIMAGGGASVSLNVAPGAIVINGNASGDDIVRALDAYVRRGGLIPADLRRRFGTTG